MELFFVLGRVLLGGLFVFAGIQHVIRTEEAVKDLIRKKVPAARSLVLISGVVLVFAGASIVTWLWPQIGITLLIMFLVVTTPIMHDFWNMPNAAPEVRLMQMRYFVTNTMLIGALFILLTTLQ